MLIQDSRNLSEERAVFFSNAFLPLPSQTCPLFIFVSKIFWHLFAPCSLHYYTINTLPIRIEY